MGASSAFGQKQEQKLVDRLLRPNVALVNSAQNRKFGSRQTNQFNKAARTQSFSQVRASAATRWTRERVLTPQQFATRHFRRGVSTANISSRSQLIKTDTVIATPRVSAGTRVAPESGETTAVREYPGTRPFLGTGKSQKALQAQDKPLTIEQVRELLNKSK